MDIVEAAAQAYAEKYTSALSGVASINLSDTLAHNPHAQMISGHSQGMLLKNLCALLQVEKVLEIGTFTGFSALCMSEGLKPGGEIHTIELREEDAHNARALFEKAGAKNINVYTGDAKNIIPTLNETWDFIFIDADKVSYIDYYELTLPTLKKGGCILADNVLFHGDVLAPEIKGKNAIAIDKFNQHVAQDTRVEQVMLTVRDGLLLIRKL
ncbi:MAG: class I SAM-dependent methyltransferase [Ferruginibacter sp.]